MRIGYLMRKSAPQHNWTRTQGGVTPGGVIHPSEFLEDISPVTFEDVLMERHVEMRVRYEY